MPKNNRKGTQVGSRKKAGNPNKNRARVGPGRPARNEPTSQTNRKARVGTEPLYEPNHALSGRDLKRAANEMVKREIRPVLKGANRELEQLNAQEKAVLNRTGVMGEQGNANIKSYYDQLAAQETAFLNAQQGSQAALQQFLSGNAAQTQQALGDAQNAAMSSLSPTPQPIASQQRLAEMGEEYRSQAAQNSQVQNKGAAENAKAYTDFAAGMAGAAGARGGEQLSAYNRQIANRLSEIGGEFGQNRNKILGTKAELLERRPELTAKALEALRRESRETYQTNKALGLEEEKYKDEKEGKTGGIAYLKTQYRLGQKKLKEEEAKRMKELQVQGASEAEKRAEEHSFREKEMQFQKEFQEKKEKGKNGEAGGWRSFGEANRYMQSLPGISPKTLLNGTTVNGVKLTGKQVRHKTFIKLTQNGIDAKTAKQVIARTIKQYSKKISKDPNGKSMGR